jgi:hypothetical protein
LSAKTAVRASALCVKPQAIDGGRLAVETGQMGGDSQSSDAVLMVRPAAFGFNPETAATNVFAAAVATECAAAALAEFDRAAARLRDAGVDVLVLEDLPDPAKPDAAFPKGCRSTPTGRSRSTRWRRRPGGWSGASSRL